MKKSLVHIVVVAVLAMLLSNCGQNPERPINNYDVCASALQIHSIYQERLPADLYAFPSPKELYESINDPFTKYYEKDSTENFLGALNSNRGGIGILVDSAESGILILQVFANSPGQKAGLQKRDTIVAINGITLDTMKFSSRVIKLAGSISDIKQLQIRRAGVGNITISITLGEYKAPSVFVDTIDSDIAVILMTIFADSTISPQGTSGEFSEALNQTSWAKFTILDLRGNGGGLLSQCLDISGEFVDSNTKIMNSHERYADEKAAPMGITLDVIWSTAKRNGNALNRNFYILQDRGTASASEIVITCIQEYRSDIYTVGTYSFGKGKGQKVFYPTPDSGLAKITYSLIKPYIGQPYDGIGIRPKYELADSVDALVYARNDIRQRLGTILAKRSFDSHDEHRYNRIRSQVVRKMAEPLAVVRMR